MPKVNTIDEFLKLSNKYIEIIVLCMYNISEVSSMGNLIKMWGEYMKKIGLVLLAVFLFGFVLAGCDNGDGNKEEEKKETGFTVTVTDLPPMEGGNIYGASLMAITAPNTPVAVGTLEKGVFTFFNPTNTTTGYPFPDTKNPFKTAGEYMLAIAETNIKILEDGTFEAEIVATYMYIKDGQPGTINFTDTNKNVTLAWDNFNEFQY
jgi:hypothetical protein